ncbi:M16 family metallopeptidase [Dichotomicrobium thermohalophilum]|uniref:Zinc protease n=1 Tax=Dichotomicrobium thermohalophilum TaxID=933063 RepID=A0A397PED9_9HYPH|nr:pitrilysin family protein [Dichotomicrobium thermohalophilum]RIA47382.1 zinc protease [Dichotomicrobium thermohalophilum]
MLRSRAIAALCVKAFSVLTFVAVLFATSHAANAMRIQKVVSPSGIEAWLIEEHRIPLITMEFGFDGAGAKQDPDDKAGRAHFLSGMLDEGAGEMDAQAFQQRLEDLAIRLSFDAGRDNFTGRLQTLTANKDEAARLLSLALSEPRFDADAMERIRGSIQTDLKFAQEDPGKVSTREWFELAFTDHPYARPTKGTLETVEGITAQDLRDAMGDTFARSNLKVAVVGDITAEELAPMLDEMFGGLPAKATLREVADAKLASKPEPEIVTMDVPQSTVRFGLPGYKRHHEDFYAAYVLNYIIGGGGFASRLMEEVREKRGLAYSVFTYLYPLDHAGMMIGGVATKNEAVGQSIEVIREVLSDIAENGVSDETLKYAKQYLVGSYALRFDTSGKIAQQLLGVQLDELGIDYFDSRNSYIEAVTQEDIKRVAADLLKPEQLITVIVGQPRMEAAPRG